MALSYVIRLISPLIRRPSTTLAYKLYRIYISSLHTNSYSLSSFSYSHSPPNRLFPPEPFFSDPPLTEGNKQQYTFGGLRIQKRQPYGVELALLASIVLAGSSIPRAIKTQKPLPIGLSIIAAFGLYSFGLAFQNRQR